MKTEQLIAKLARDVRAVPRVAPTWRRTCGWALATALYLALLTSVMSPRDDLGVRMTDVRFMMEQAAALLTGLTAAAAAFASVIPGYRREVILVPIGFAMFWIALVAAGAVQDIRAAGVVFGGDWQCVTTVLGGAALPTILMAQMIRRGAPVSPRATAGLAALAAAGLGNLGACLFHPHNSNLIVLVWHCGLVAAIALAATLLGRTLLPWPVSRAAHDAR
jgi:hypothetical protein